MSLPTDLTDDALTGSYRLFQRRRGHRYSLDDTLTAMLAAQARPTARTVLDLGTGIGSVLLMLAYKLPAAARLWGIEAQAESFALLEQNCARNAAHGASGRVSITHGDIRDHALVQRVRAESGGFELVTGTPPYQPPGQGTVSPDAQRAHARVELRGGIEVYLQAAASALAVNGVAVVCADARTPGRVQSAAKASGLLPLTYRDVIAGAGKPALFSVWSFALAANQDAPTQEPTRLPDFRARDEAGRRTAEALAVRSFFDLPVSTLEAPSPVLRARRGQLRREPVE